MEITLKGRPYAAQLPFFLAKNKYIAYGGARGGGKSWAARRKALLLLLNPEYQGIQILFLRRRYNDIYENHIYPLMRELQGAIEYKERTKSFDAPGGGRLIFGYCDSEKDILQYQGKAYDCIFVEEATQFTEMMLTSLTESLRLSGMMENPYAWSPRMYLTCNPGGVGHAYIKRLFIDREFRGEEKPENYVMIRARVYDNEYLMTHDPTYVDNLKNLPEQRRKAMLDGDWDVYEGQFFTEFRNNPDGQITQKYTHVIAPFAISPSWRRYMAMDWGYSKPFSIGWYAVDYDGVLFRYREWYGTTGEANKGARLTPEEVAHQILAIEAEFEKGQEIIRIADPAIFSSDTGESIADTFRKQGIYFRRADNSRLAGWQQVRERMKFDEEGYPMLRIFATCRHLIRTLPILTHDINRAEDLDTTLEDHAADELRYMCMARPMKTDRDDKIRVDRNSPLYTEDKKDNYGLGFLL